MGVLKDWSSIMESLTEIDVFEASMSLVPFLESVEEHGHYSEVYVKGGFEKAFNKAFFEDGERRDRQLEPYMGLFAHDYPDFYNGALLSDYEKLFENEEPLIERGQLSYAFTKSEGVTKVLFPLVEEENGHEAKAVFTLPEAIFGYSEAVYSALTDKEDSSMADGYKEAMEKGAVEKILSGGARETKDARKHEIKVEMISREGSGEDFDMDEMLEKMTEQLCAMMAKGADGIYM